MLSTGRMSEASLVAQWIRICLPMQETRVQFLHQQDSLDKEMATHSSILACETPWTEEPGGYNPWIHKRIGHDLVTK